MARVLIVDDEKGIRLTLREFLRQAGYDVTIAEDSTQALETLKTESIDVVVTDIILPRMSGITLLKAIRAAAPHVQVILITGEPTFETAAEALRSGALDYLQKPVGKEAILKVVGNAARIKSLDDEKRRLEQENLRHRTHLEQLVEERTHDYSASRDELRRSQVRYLAVIRSTPHGLCIIAQDWTLEFANLAMSTLFMSGDASAERLMGCSFQSLFPTPEDFIAYKESAIPSVRKNGVDSRDVRMKKLDSTVFWCEISIVRHDPSATVAGFVATITDISARRDAAEALRASEERYALAARGANDGLWDWDLLSNKVYYAPRWKEMLGHAPDEIRDTPGEWLDRIHPEESTFVKVALQTHFSGQTDHFEIEHRLRHKNGTFRWVQVRGIAVRDDKGNPTRIAGSLTDVTGRKDAEQQLLRKAWYDETTGLANRSSFMNRLEHRLVRARRNNDFRFAVLFVDIDRFKNINDSLGHHAGDQMLREIGDRMLGFFRPSDTVARLGGDEFGVLLDELHVEEDAQLVADRFRRLLAPPIAIGGHDLHVTASIGVAIGNPACQKAETLLRDADTAMFRAKDKGRDQTVLFDETFHARAVETLELERDLRAALRAAQFLPSYQAILSLGDRRIVGFEALIRWNHPKRGLLNPGDFIPYAEETGLIIPIDLHIVEKACRDLRRWQDRFRFSPPLSLHVNFSARHFSQPSVVSSVETILARTGFEPDRLHIEITETLLLDQPEKVAPLLEEIRRTGVHFSIDDFGTGYSSLSYLHRFPIDILKIDRSFISHLEKEKRSATIVRTIIALAGNLDLKVIAEGVETESQARTLTDLGCQFAQGFLFSKPIFPDAIPLLIEKHNGHPTPGDS